MDRRDRRETDSSPLTDVFAHGGIYGIEQVVQVVLAFGLLPLYARYLGPAGLGIVGTLASLASVLGILLLQGMDSAWFRIRILPEVREDYDGFKTTILVYLAGASAAGALVFFLVGPFLAPFLTPNIPFWPWWPLVLTTATGAVFTGLFRATALSERKSVKYILFAIAQQLATAGLIVLMIVPLEKGALGQVQAGALAGASFGLFALVLLRPYRRPEAPRPKLSLTLGYSLPVLPHMLAVPLNVVIDRTIVIGLLGPAFAGVYVVAQQVAGLTNRVTTSLNRAYAPIFNEIAQEGVEAGRESPLMKERLGALAELSGNIILAALGVALGVALVGREVLMVLAGPEFAGAAKLILILVGAELLYVFYTVFNRAIFFHRESVRYIPLLSWTALGVNLAGNVILIPIYGVTGAAMATVFSQAALAALTLRVANWRMRVPYRWRRIIPACLAFALTVMVLGAVDARVEAHIARIGLKVCVVLPLLAWSGFAIYRGLQRDRPGLS
jgi:O-antigen/teichoic acid export membrane protein